MEVDVAISGSSLCRLPVANFTVKRPFLLPSAPDSLPLVSFEVDIFHCYNRNSVIDITNRLLDFGSLEVLDRTNVQKIMHTRNNITANDLVQIQ